MNTSLTNSTSHIMDQWLNAIASSIVIGNQFVNLLVGLSLNSYILFCLISGSIGMDMFVTFVMNQAASEILLSFSAPLSIMCHVSVDLCYSKPLGFFWGISMSSRSIFQCCVCLERYLAVVHPITFLKYNQMSYRLSCSGLCWTVALACSILSIFTFPHLPYTFLGVVYSTILALELFCCLSILEVLRRPGPGDMEKERERKEGGINAVKRKAFIIVFINLMTFLMQTIPICTTFLLQNKFLSLYWFNLAVAICMSLNFAAGFVQPIFFLHRADKFRFLTCA